MTPEQRARIIEFLESCVHGPTASPESVRRFPAFVALEAAELLAEVAPTERDRSIYARFVEAQRMWQARLAREAAQGE